MNKTISEKIKSLPKFDDEIVEILEAFDKFDDEKICKKLSYKKFDEKILKIANNKFIKTEFSNLNEAFEFYGKDGAVLHRFKTVDEFLTIDGIAEKKQEAASARARNFNGFRTVFHSEIYGSFDLLVGDYIRSFLFILPALAQTIGKTYRVGF